MNKSPQQQQQQRRKFQKIRRKFLKKKVFLEALISYRSYRIEKKTLILYRYRILSRKKPLYRIESKKSLSLRGDYDLSCYMWLLTKVPTTDALFHLSSNWNRIVLIANKIARHSSLVASLSSCSIATFSPVATVIQKIFIDLSQIWGWRPMFGLWNISTQHRLTHCKY